MSLSDRELAMRLLPAFASSDLTSLEPLTAETVHVIGTEESELWTDRESLFAALDRMRSLGLRAEWSGDLMTGPGWVAGTALYTMPGGATLAARVSFVFADGKLVHGHFSVPEDAPAAGDRA
jgi:hypothetical protein